MAALEARLAARLGAVPGAQESEIRSQEIEGEEEAAKVEISSATEEAVSFEQLASSAVHKNALERLPPLEELMPKIPSEVRAALDDLFRAKFTGVKKFSSAASTFAKASVDRPENR